MTREKYESLPLATLRELAKARKMKGISTLKKGDLIEAMLAQDDKEKQEEANAQAKEEVKEKKEGTDIEQLDSGRTANGILEVLPDGYGFIRCENPVCLCKYSAISEMYMCHHLRSGASI